MGGLVRVSIIVFVLVALFVWTGEVLTAVSDTGAGGGGGEVGADLGQAVFYGKGKCYTCHSIGGEGSAVRCPNLGVAGDRFKQPIGVRAAEMRAADDYSAVKYLVESLYEPNAFVVPGYTKGLMTPVHRPPIGLGDDQIASVVLYLLEKSGIDADETQLAEIRKEQRVFSSRGAGEDEGPPPVAFTEGDAESGRDAYSELKCMQCHKVEGVEFDVEGEIPKGGVGPDLTSIGAIQTREYLIESMTSPNSVIVADPPGVKPGEERSYRNKGGDSKMPEFHDTITLRQLLDIADFLKLLTDPESNAKLFEE